PRAAEGEDGNRRRGILPQARFAADADTVFVCRWRRGPAPRWFPGTGADPARGADVAADDRHARPGRHGTDIEKPASDAGFGFQSGAWRSAPGLHAIDAR